MTVRISIDELVGTFEMLSDSVDYFLNARTGEIRPVTVDDRLLLERDESPDHLPEWQRSILPVIREVLESDEWLQLPDQREIHEWSIMERFCRKQDDELRDKLLDAIHGRSAFRAFRGTIDRMGLREAWFAYRRRALEEIARAWLEKQGLAAT